MSRIGRKPIPVPTGVTVSISPQEVRVNGPRGELFERIPRDITVAQEGEELDRSATKSPANSIASRSSCRRPPGKWW